MRHFEDSDLDRLEKSQAYDEFLSRKCLTCVHFSTEEEYKFTELDGICKLSCADPESKFMQLSDEMELHDPYLMVSKDFGCNQYERNR